MTNQSYVVLSNVTPMTLLQKCRGELHIRAEVVTNTKDIFVANFSGKKLKNTDGIFGRSDPFLVIHRIMEDGAWTKVWQNERIDNNLNPVWPISRIPMTALCNGDIDRPIKIETWDHQSNGKHQYMGCVETSVRGLVGSKGAPFDVIEADKKAKKASYVNSGTLIVANAAVEHYPTLAEVCMHRYDKTYLKHVQSI